jgi:hypothetical protein
MPAVFVTMPVRYLSFCRGGWCECEPERQRSGRQIIKSFFMRISSNDAAGLITHFHLYSTQK